MVLTLARIGLGDLGMSIKGPYVVSIA